MSCTRYCLSILLLVALVGCERSENKWPQAEVRPVQTHPERTDPYAYLADPSDPATLRYLEAEQLVTDAWQARNQSLIRRLVTELSNRLPTETQSTRVFHEGYYYFREIESGGQYPVFIREDEDGQRQTLLDMNRLPVESNYRALGDFAVSPAGDSIAYSLDTNGAERFDVWFGEIGGDHQIIASGVGRELVWLNETQLLLIDQFEVISVDVESAGRRRLYQESDPSMSLNLMKVAGEVLLLAENHQTSEWFVLTEAGFVTIAGRQQGHKFRLLPTENGFLVATNYQRENYSLMQTSAVGVSPENWTPVLTPDGFLRDFDVVDNDIVLLVRQYLSDQLQVRNSSGAVDVIAQAGPDEDLQLMDPKQGAVRYRRSRYSDDSNVDTQVLWFEARDQTSIPVTMIRRTDQLLRGLIINVYGAYGINLPRQPDPFRDALLDRGIAWVQVHVRGGGELGPGWHKAGSGNNKINSFNDLEDSLEFLRQQELVGAESMIMRGSSAGATLAALVVVRQPELFDAVSLRHPSLDLVTTLSDPNLKLSPADWLEWGDPSEEDHLEALLSLSPYEQIDSVSYPPVLISAAAEDARVPTYEAVKFMARLRAHDLGEQRHLIDISSNSGHLGSTDQYDRRLQDAMELAFILNELGIEE